MNSKKWIKIFILLTLLGIIFVGGVNYFINPYGISEIENKLDKFRIDSKIRLIKAIQIKDIKPSSLILGTSRAEIAYDPNHNLFTKPSYNSAISGGTMYENLLYFQHAIKQGNLKYTLLVLDFRMFNSKKQSRIDNIESLFNQSLFTYMFSMSTLKDSLLTLKGTTKPYTKYLKNGQADFINNEEENYNENELKNKILKREKYYYSKMNSNYIYSDSKKNSLFDLKRFIKIAQDHNVKLDVIFGPSHIRQWEALNLYIDYSRWQKWKKDIVNIVNDSDYTVVDFATYNEYTSEEIPTKKGSKMTYYYESSHYKKELGDIILNHLLKKQDNDIGIVLNPINIDKHFEKQLVKRKELINEKKYLYEVNNFN